MDIILCIETGTEVCSVSLSKRNEIVAFRESSEPQAHARLLSVFIDEILKEAKLSTEQLSAVAVSEGPGSYTGLRIGVSTAKGICFGSNIPMIAVGSLAAITKGAVTSLNVPDALYCPMIDARRMEVYTALYDSNIQMKKEIQAAIIDENSFKEELDKGIVYFFGNGSAKCSTVITHPNAKFLEIVPSAVNMAPLALEKFRAGVFVDVAYYEPFYLKDFVVTKSKKNLLGL